MPVSVVEDAKKKGKKKKMMQIRFQLQQTQCAAGTGKKKNGYCIPTFKPVSTKASAVLASTSALTAPWKWFQAIDGPIVLEY